MSKEKASSRINSRIGGGSSAPKPGFRPGGFSVVKLFPLVVAVTVGVGAIFVFSGKEPEAKNTVVTPENIEEVIAEMKEEERTPMGSYEVFMTTDWTFSDGSSASKDAYVLNPTANKNTVYFTITLSSGEQVYKSPYIPVGSSLNNITLDTPLEKGFYKSVLTYHLVDESNEEVSKVSVSVNLTIKN